MKKLIIIFLVCLQNNLNAQVNAETENQKPLSDIELSRLYMKKSRDQKTAGWIFLGSGITLNFIGTFLVPAENEKEAKVERPGTSAALFLVGSVSALMSIPLFISGANNKVKAEFILSERNIPLSFEKGRNISLNSIGIGITLGK